LCRNTMLGLPGSDEAFTPENVLAALQTYKGIDAALLKQHLFYFLQQVVPVAEAAGLQMAIHPDDPPYPVLGLPRVMSTQKDVEDLLRPFLPKQTDFVFVPDLLGPGPTMI